ncbi:MAG: hypothetical protein WBF53_00415 [Litorimonas sp.]
MKTIWMGAAALLLLAACTTPVADVEAPMEEAVTTETAPAEVCAIRDEEGTCLCAVVNEFGECDEGGGNVIVPTRR